MLKGYRTYVVAMIVALIGFLAELSPEKWNALIDDPSGGIGMILSGAVMAIMRAVTTTPPGKSDASSDPQ